jgi:hypothetical protein
VHHEIASEPVRALDDDRLRAVSQQALKHFGEKRDARPPDQRRRLQSRKTSRRASTATNVDVDKGSDKRQRQAIEAFAKAAQSKRFSFAGLNLRFRPLASLAPRSPARRASATRL